MNLHEFFMYFIICGLLLVALVYIPNQLYNFWKRWGRKRTHLCCRLCGYRFIKSDESATCPHCHGRNHS